MKLKYDFSVMDMGDEIVAVPVGDNADQFHGMIRLNSTAAEILELLREDTTPPEVHKILMERYPDSTRDEIGVMLANFLNQLYREDALLVP